MEKIVEHRYICKRCNKSFPCGRSLGGHMKSHVINDLRKKPKTKLKSINNIRFDRNPINTLEENKKLCKFSDTLDENLSSLVSGDRKRALDIQRDNEIEVSRKKKKRSKRGKDKYNGNVVNSSVMEIEKQQEEVALCLIMLSRDLGCENRGFCSVSESSNNDFELVGVGSSVKGTKIVKNKDSCSLSSLKFKSERNGELKSGSESSRFNVEIQSVLGYKEKESVDFNQEYENVIKSTKPQVRMRSIKRNGKQDRVKFSLGKNDLDGNQLDLSENLSNGNSNIEMEKRNKFGCTSCNKTFHSFQALGGHKASHNKINSCFPTKFKNSNKVTDENNLDTKIGCDLKMKKIKAQFECQICSKAFSSGQALGGHKRSHLIIGADTKPDQTSIIQKQIPEIRDFLDLNLPAMTEEEDEESSGFKPWWVDNNVNAHETFIGLLSN